jgi:hypothetical protein
MEAITLYLSIVSAYLLVAYTTGKDLSTLQVTIITVLFLSSPNSMRWIIKLLIRRPN